MRKFRIAGALAMAAAGALVTAGAVAGPAAAAGTATATPIKHLVVIFGENVSFDHYFGTYPNAANADGTRFTAAPGTPTVNGLTPALLSHNPNAAQPRRLGPAQAVTCDQNHGYTAEQKAFDGGLMDSFVRYTGVENCAAPMYSAPGLVMDYYDGNTVTALWNYAQHYAMNDNSYGTNFGPSTPGALNLVTGQTYGAIVRDPSGAAVSLPNTVTATDANLVGTDIGDIDPYFDACSNPTRDTMQMTGRNVGDLLNARHVTWGWFEGGFRPTGTGNGRPICGATHANVGGITSTDYIPHHEPFQYYESTANPNHLPPASIAEIGNNGRANHQYDMTDFYAALRGHNLPSVSFLKAPAYADGHAGYSDPIDEQRFVVDTINRLQHSPYWHDTAVVLSYDDSDGWYDHQMSPILNSSADSHDALTAPGVCGNGTPLAGEQGRCGYGPRLPLLIVSPYARRNFVDNTTTDQSSILRFIEDNWLGGARIAGSFDQLAGTLSGMFDFQAPRAGRLFLNPTTGAPAGPGR